jgi:hypothetical protein
MSIVNKICGFTEVLALLVPVVTGTVTTDTSFTQWCQARKWVPWIPAETKRTVDGLLEEAGTKDCQAADLKLIRIKMCIPIYLNSPSRKHKIY